MRASAAWFCGGLLGVAVVLEAVFQVLPTSTATRTGYHVDPNILTYPPGHAFRTSFGWALDRPQQHRANNLGFVARRDYAPDPNAIVLIGDSYVEASMLEPQDRLDAQLERRAPGRTVYAMGGPGSNLLDYVERVRLASERLGTREFVIVVERGDIRQSLCGSGNVHAACLYRATLEPRLERQSPNRSGLADVLRRSALAQYLFGHIRIDPAGLARKVAGPLAPRRDAPAAPDPALVQRQGEAVVQEFIRRLEPYRQARFTLVLGCDLDALRQGRVPAADPARDRLAEAARAFGVRVVDTEPLFAAHLKAGGLALGVSPRDAHWNEIATGLVASAVAKGSEPAR